MDGLVEASDELLEDGEDGTDNGGGLRFGMAPRDRLSILLELADSFELEDIFDEALSTSSRGCFNGT